MTTTETTQPSVLIIDDERDLREALATALGYEGFTTYTADDAESGLALALEKKPDVIFLDVIMPKIDGTKMLKQLREDPWGSGARVIVMTALDSMHKAADALEQGATEYVAKSTVTLGALVEKAKRHTQLKRETVD